MQVAAIQYDIIWEDPAKNIELLNPLLASAKEQGADLIVLPEMFSCGFSMNSEKIAEEPDGISATFLMESAKNLGVWIAGTYPEKTNGSPPAFNQLLLAGPNGETHKYAKMHLFTFGDEHSHYMAGKQPLNTKISGGIPGGIPGEINLSAFICYDIRFGNEFYDLANQTDLYIIPANWPRARQAHWETLLRARAIENQAFVIGTNRIGEGGGIKYAGGSAIISPHGEILAQGGDQEEILISKISGAEVAEVRKKFPVLKDRS